MVTHDRYFLDNVTGWILELDRGRGIPLRRQLFGLSGSQGQAHGAGRARRRQPPQGPVTRTGWIASSPKARQAKSKARIRAYDELVAAAENRRPGEAQIIIPIAERLGQVVIEADNISKSYDGRVLFENLSFKLPPGGIVGVIGPNGAGKSTLFRLITGQEQPDTGSIRIGDTVQLSYVDQSRDSLDGSKNVWEEISGGTDIVKLGKYEMNSRAYCGAFNFKGTDQQNKVGNLSGGQRNRVHLAKMLKSGGNVLLLDEPTNDLDTETLGALEDALEDFAGCAVIISHDRMFLDRLATHILALKATAMWNGSKATSKTTRKTRSAASAPKRPIRSARPTSD
ncbi:hypothetical protein Lal_00008669 [Lupinus albus]|nr:hypothetical protein Lal_00008669 [Lupinus albus]